MTEDYAPNIALLQLYVTHTVLTDYSAVPSQYHTVYAVVWCLDDAETFRTAISALRNARRWARDQRDDLIRLSNGIAMRSCAMIPESFC